MFGRHDFGPSVVREVQEVRLHDIELRQNDIVRGAKESPDGVFLQPAADRDGQVIEIRWCFVLGDGVT